MADQPNNDTPPTSPPPLSPIKTPTSLHINPQIAGSSQNLRSSTNFGWTTSHRNHLSRYGAMNPIPAWGSYSNHADNLTPPLLPLGACQSLEKLSPKLTAACDEVSKDDQLDQIKDENSKDGEENEEDMECSDEDAESNTQSMKTWNLRRPVKKKTRNQGKTGGGGGGAGSSQKDTATPVRVCKPRSAKARAHPRMVMEKREVVISLTKEEIERDFLLMSGEKPNKRPNKRPQKVQKSLEHLFPGMYLTNITPELYGVNDDPPLMC